MLDAHDADVPRATHTSSFLSSRDMQYLTGNPSITFFKTVRISV
jgi:hypothetical protein